MKKTGSMYGIEVSVVRSARHNWPDAPKHLKYLRDSHRHDFVVTVQAQGALEPNRGVAFEDLEKLLNVKVPGVIKEDTTMSCEQMASSVYWEIIHIAIWKGELPKIQYKVIVAEDDRHKGYYIPDKED